MGTFTDNLLKLTEFPFSYSFIGLLALIFGEGLNLDEPSLETFGPLLIFMGFVATTLSITDPFGALQKYLLKGLNRDSSESLHRRESETVTKDEFERKSVLGKKLSVSGKKSVSKKESENPREADEGKDKSPLRECFKSYASKYSDRRASPEAKSLFESRSIRASLSYDFLKWYTERPKHERSLDVMEDKDRFQIYLTVLSLRESTLKTKWVTREIDKITSMFYFIIVILTFIIALFVVQGLEYKFVAAFQVSNQTRDLAIQHINAAIAANETNNLQTTKTEIEAAKEALMPLIVRIAIFVPSYIALWAILYMLGRRLRHLRRNALIAFQFLMTQLAYRIAQRADNHIKDDSFKQTLDEVEQRYLDNGDWALARVSVTQLIQDYRYLFWERVQVKATDYAFDIY